MIEAVVLGIIQGITEWIPVSSEGMFVLAKVKLFHSSLDIQTLILQSLFLHLGTFFAALVYFRKEIAGLIKAIFSFKRSDTETKKTFLFLFLTTIISGLLGVAVMFGMKHFSTYFQDSGKIVTILVSILLLITAALQLRSQEEGKKDAKALRPADGVALGIIQGFAALPGLSRSGTTIACLLIKGFDKTVALRLSFLMSLPIIFAGNIIFNLRKAQFSPENLVSLAVSFVVGLFSINLLFKIASKVNFGFFVACFALLVLSSVFF
ncbi:MAG: undecaprenyl-diphosphate phosphatase [Candidatus Omnitrophota bacterium]